MGKKEFVVAAFDLDYKTFVVHVVSLSSTLLDVYLCRRPQISGLITKKAPTKVSNKYVNFTNVFFPDLASELSKHTGINDHAIKLVINQQPPYGSIYSIKLVELETLKIYIETNLANGFIRPSKLLASALILFDRKPDGFFQLFVNHMVADFLISHIRSFYFCL